MAPSFSRFLVPTRVVIPFRTASSPCTLACLRPSFLLLFFRRPASSRRKREQRGKESEHIHTKKVESKIEEISPQSSRQESRGRRKREKDPFFVVGLGPLDTSIPRHALFMNSHAQGRIATQSFFFSFAIYGRGSRSDGLLSGQVRTWAGIMAKWSGQ